jgi:segregation and condensation protein B
VSTAPHDTADPDDSAGQTHEIALDIDAFPGGVPAVLEAVLMVVDEPVAAIDLAAALELPLGVVEAHLRSLEAEYAEQQRGFCLRQVAGGWRYYSRTSYGPLVEKFVIGGQQAKLTQAALETLAVVAYLQPVSRARVGAVRGVNVESVLRTLTARGLVEETEVHADSGAILYRTTPYFLERMGLNSIDELPPIAPHLPDPSLLDQLAEEGRL